MVGAEHHLAVLEQLDARVEFVDAAIWQGVFPDQQADLDGQVHESAEAPAELVGYGCVQLGEGLRGGEALGNGSSGFERDSGYAGKQRRVVL